MQQPKIQGRSLDNHVNGNILLILNEMLAPVLLKRGDGEYGIGREQAKADIRTALEQKLGPHPWKPRP